MNAGINAYVHTCMIYNSCLHRSNEELHLHCALFLLLYAGIGITNNVSVEELYAYALNPKAIEFVDSYGSLGGAVNNASLYINSFPCQKSIRPTSKFG